MTNGGSKHQSLMVMPNRLVPKSNCSSIGCPLSIINWWIYHYGNLIIPSWSVAKSSLSYGSLRIYQLSICWLQDACPPFQRQRHSHINACWLFLLSYPTILYHHIKSPVGMYIYVGIFIYIYTCIHMNPLLVIDPHPFDIPKKSPRRRFTLLKTDVGAWRGAMDASRSHLHGQLLRLLPVLNGGVYWYGGTHRCPFPIGRLINRGVCLPL